MSLVSRIAKPIAPPDTDDKEHSIAVPELNKVLHALSQGDRELIFPRLSLIELSKGTTLYEHCPKGAHIYFPVDAVLSMRHMLADGHSCDLARVGREGMISLAFCRQAGVPPYCIQVQVGGKVFRIKSSAFFTEVDNSASLRALLLRCFNSVLMQVGQSVACNRYHTVYQQLCRYLLEAMDHGVEGSLDMTHEQIAESLGVRREGVTEAAIKLQTKGLIRYRHGHIDVLDREGLTGESCECYTAVKQQIDDVLPE